MDKFISLDKQKRWKENRDLKSIREYNCWKAQNFRNKQKSGATPKLLSEEEKKKKISSKKWYLDNRERILDNYHKNKTTMWIDVDKEDREFVLNFNPNKYPKYIEARNKMILNLKLFSN